MYFANFPKIYYPFQYTGGPRMHVVRDITLNIRPVREILENVVYYDDYDIQDGDTPEIIAERIYGDPLLHWIIMLVNEKYHWQQDFPVPEQFFEEYLVKLYGEGNADRVHLLHGRRHYVSPTGLVVDEGTMGARMISNREYETELNDAKRRIRIVNPSLISIFVKDLQEAFPSE